MEHIINQIKTPTFPERDFSVTSFGALGDGVSDSTKAIQDAIDTANREGGGRVVLDEGIYMTGPIYLKSHVNLHLKKGAILSFTQDTSKYLPAVLTRWEGMELYNYKPLIYSYQEKNIAITGQGTINGNGDNEHWWPWKGKSKYGWKEGIPHQKPARDRLNDMVELGTPVDQRRFGEGDYLRPSFFQPYQTDHILIEGVTFKDSPMWFLHPVLCEHIWIDDVKIVGHGPNNDGFDPECCRNVLIQNCFFDNGDDNIAIKSGRNADGRKLGIASENIVIRNNVMKDGHGAVVIGSEISGGVRNVYADGNVMNSPNLDIALRIKTNSVRGGLIENIYFTNNKVENVGGEIFRVNFYYEEGDAGEHTPIVRNVEVNNLESKGGNCGIRLEGYKRSPISNIKITNVVINDVKTPTLIKNVENIEFTNVKINGVEYNNTIQKDIED